MTNIFPSGQGEYYHQFFHNPYKDQLKALEQLPSEVVEPAQFERLKKMSEDIDKQIEEYKKQLT